MWYDPLGAAAGVLLVFVLPGLTSTKALFPEWRFRGPDALVRVVEVAALSLVLSVGYTVLIGFGLLNLPGTGFSATWSDPILELLLLGVVLVGLALGWARGAYRSEPPAAPPLEDSGGEEGGWELLRETERLAREERRLRHALRVSPNDAESARLNGELDRVSQEMAELRERRVREYGS